MSGDQFTQAIKSSIDTERQYTRLLRDCAFAGGAAYDKSYDQAKGDIEERCTRRYLYTPAEYYQAQLDNSDREQQQRSDSLPDRSGTQQHNFRSSKSREADDDRGR